MTQRNTRPCTASGKQEITLKCDYTASPHSASEDITGPRIVINRAALSFSADDESHMLVELTFTNAGGTSVSDARTVYLAIDDDAGRNYLRRPLPKMNLREVAPGQRVTFSDQLLAPSFSAGHYRIQLWIPSADPSLRFDKADNFLLDSAGVADPATGLNTLATFTVGATMRSAH